MAGKFMRSNHDPNNILVTGADIDIDIRALLLLLSLSHPTVPPATASNNLGLLGRNSKQPGQCKDRRLF